jgi:RNA polymerase sigma-70 factor (sigma-E family)
VPDPARGGPAGRRAEIERDFASWVDDHQRSLLAFAQLVSGDDHGAEDLVQQSLTKAYLRWDRLSEPGQNPQAYVRRIIVNDNASLWRQTWKRREHPTAQPPDRAALAGEPVVDTTWHLVQSLPLRQRTVVALRFYADLSVAETADLMGCSTGAVKTHTSRAMAKLKTALTESDADV